MSSVGVFDVSMNGAKMNPDGPSPENDAYVPVVQEMSGCIFSGKASSLVCNTR